MRKWPLIAVAFAALSVFPAEVAGLAQTAQPPPPQNAAPALYALTMGDMMNTLIQPRHTKLGLAGSAENWPLAGYATVEIRQAFAGIVRAQPRFRGFPVGELVEAALGQR